VLFTINRAASWLISAHDQMQSALSVLRRALQAGWARYVPGQYSSGSAVFVSTCRGVAVIITAQMPGSWRAMPDKGIYREQAWIEEGE
jgi:hypothetical protein